MIRRRRDTGVSALLLALAVVAGELALFALAVGGAS